MHGLTWKSEYMIVRKKVMHPLIKIVKEQKSGNKIGITSICSANEFVVNAAVIRAKEKDEYLLIESTANQVNQYGGYTGMTPKDFVKFVKGIAKKHQMDMSKLILGGDHLGPLAWTTENEAEAMIKAKDLIKEYVYAGYTKIHIDTSMRLNSDNKNQRLSDYTIANRAAELCNAAEDAFNDKKTIQYEAEAPVYIIGSEVPIPGGSQSNDELNITKSEDLVSTINAFKEAFIKRDIISAWERVVGVVVQPGVEFGDNEINEYDRTKAKDLINALKIYPNMVFEGHSTDYQTPKKLRELVEDGVAILKVGPAVTFALREALFALSTIEEEVYKGSINTMSRFKSILENEMLNNNSYWKKHYKGDSEELLLKRKYSYSDRCRYYLPMKSISDSISLMIKNLEIREIPFSLLSQYMPIQYSRVRAGLIDNKPISLIYDRIGNCLDDYGDACVGGL